MKKQMCRLSECVKWRRVHRTEERKGGRATEDEEK